MRWTWKILSVLFKGTLTTIKAVSTVLIVLTFLVSLTMNVAVFSTGVIATAVASAVEFVTGTETVLSQLKVASNKAAKWEGKAVGTDLRLASSLDKTAKLEAELIATRATRKVVINGSEMAAKDAVKMVSQRVKKRTAKLAASDLGSTLGQSIPWIGVAVVVAATAYDLSVSCDNMQDMHTLEVAFNPNAANDPSVAEVCGMKVPTKEEIWDTIKVSPGVAWDRAKVVLDGLPDMPSVDWPSMPEVRWKFWE